MEFMKKVEEISKKVGDTATNTYNTVADKSGKLIEETKLRIANAPGTIDAEYRGEIGVIMNNTGNLSHTINKGDKIAQMVIMPVPMIKWIETDELSDTERGEGGYGSTDQE